MHPAPEGLNVTQEFEAGIERSAAQDPIAVFEGLAALVYAGDDYEAMYRAVCEAAVKLVDGCQHASLMLRQNGRTITVGATDDTARHIDELEREIGEGPCVDAIEEEVAVLDPDLVEDSEWPRLRDQVVVRTPVRGMAGFRLLVNDRKAGALNIFSDRPHALTDKSVDQAAVLAAFTSVVLVAADRDEQARTLREGLSSNREIGKAVGLMMAFHKVNDEEAFEILRRSSQDMNLKISAIAREIVGHHNDRPAL
jgi:AmiR/NasT family two-component response regulator